MKYGYSEDQKGQEQELQYTITRIELGYMRVMSGGGVGSYKIIPVWDFFGTVNSADAKEEASATAMSDSSLLTVNAIDGSIIDRSIGY